VIEPGQPLPVYVQLKALLQEEIARGVYGNDGQLPTEHELCQRYGISRTPVHRALAELADQGLVLRKRRRGTFVNPHWMQHNRHRAELRVLVPEGPWERLVCDACPVGATLNVVTVALEDLRATLVRAVAEGRAPDVALLDSVWVAEFVASGFLLELDALDPDWFSNGYLDDLSEAFRGAHVYDGRCFAVQAEADVAGLWYSRELFDANALEVPKTWEGFLDTCRRLVDGGVRQPLAMPAGSAGGESTVYGLLALMATNGASAIDGGEVTVRSPATVECLAFVKALVDLGALPRAAVAYGHDRAPRMLAHDEVAMSFGGSYELRTLARTSGLTVRQAWKQFGFVPPPRGPRAQASTLAGGMVHGIFRQTKQPELAARLLRGLWSKKAQTRMSLETAQLSCRRSAARDAARQWEFLRSTASSMLCSCSDNCA
jgi:multiple sugar transport system substrate-binding protein